MSNIVERKARNHPCDRCTKAFTSSHQLAQHVRVHTDERNYKCAYCDRKFKQLSHLQQHTRLHTGERPYKCTAPNCGRSFIQLSNLQQHMRTHASQSEKNMRAANEKRFFCSYCRKGFKEHSTLINHETSKHSANIRASSINAVLTGQQLQQQQQSMLVNSNSSSLSPSSTSSTSTSGGTKFSFCDRCGQVFVNDYALFGHLQQMLNDPKHQLHGNPEKVGSSSSDLSGVLMEADNMMEDMFASSLSPDGIDIKPETEDTLEGGQPKPKEVASPSPHLDSSNDSVPYNRTQ